ncbi:unnamed protein product [Paramecium sonneborni]|uniref:Protein kinase domain-containing protein n=1 Tax=Paramecium sonneborni TaxID=65129 RepID=A0A8S1NVC7_9CILI|nr:unnamed protein product [Paramecium sonneborni]
MKEHKLVDGNVLTNKLLGTGAFGSVYRGYKENDPKLIVAVKMLPPITILYFITQCDFGLARVVDDMEVKKNLLYLELLFIWLHKYQNKVNLTQSVIFGQLVLCFMKCFMVILHRQQPVNQHYQFNLKKTINFSQSSKKIINNQRSYFQNVNH